MIEIPEKILQTRTLRLSRAMKIVDLLFVSDEYNYSVYAHRKEATEYLGSDECSIYYSPRAFNERHSADGKKQHRRSKLTGARGLSDEND
jgi:hypothetical protein